MNEDRNAYAFTTFNVLHHVLVCLIRRVHSSLRSLYGKRKGINNDKSLANNLSLHDAHDLVRNTRPCMDCLGEVSMRPLWRMGRRRIPS